MGKARFLGEYAMNSNFISTSFGCFSCPHRILVTECEMPVPMECFARKRDLVAGFKSPVLPVSQQNKQQLQLRGLKVQSEEEHKVQNAVWFWGGLCWFTFYENSLNWTLDGAQVHQWPGRRDRGRCSGPSDLHKVRPTRSADIPADRVTGLSGLQKKEGWNVKVGGSELKSFRGRDWSGYAQGTLYTCTKLSKNKYKIAFKKGILYCKD